MEDLHNIHFINNSNNSSKKKEKEMDIDFLDNKYNYYKSNQEDDEYYLNRIFSFCKFFILIR